MKSLLIQIFAFMPLAAVGFGCRSPQSPQQTHAFQEMKPHLDTHSAGGKDTATFAAGCFWCVEAQSQQLAGVEPVLPGYTGGHTPDPTYEAVCSGTTGHAEACNIIYDPSIISYDELLAAFFLAHDPTQKNRQGNDIGTQYRSAIFYHNEQQREKATYYIQQLNREKAYPNEIVTQVAPYGTFFPAENYHQNYYDLNPEQPYCQMVIRPKLTKFKKVFHDKLKPSGASGAQ